MYRSEAELEDALSEPTPAVIETIARCPGDFALLGVAGKMGPTLARMIRRALEYLGETRRVIGVSRFSAGEDAVLAAQGIETIRCDLLNDATVAKLPDAANVILMTGRKFGSTHDAATTWAVNCLIPPIAYRRYRGSRVVAFSTGNVYPFTLVSSGGPTEATPPNPVGEYGMSALGRERMFEYCAREYAAPTAILRLNYACDLRYGVLVDLARKVHSEEPIDLAMGYFNTIWQGDANALTLRAFDHVSVPARVFNLTGPELLSVRQVCERFGQRVGKTPHFEGQESETALLNNATASLATLGAPRWNAEQLIYAVATWIETGGRQLGKPTHFEARDGRF